MAKAIDTGLPKMRIEEAAARRQARIDSGREAIIGINKYRLDKEDPLDILDVDNTAVREAQIRRLEQLRANRDEDKVQSCLEAITNATESGKATCLLLHLKLLVLVHPWVKFPLLLKRFVVVIKRLSALFPAYTPANMKMTM